MTNIDEIPVAIVLGVKGGGGKSIVAMNMALELAKDNYVGLGDIDIDSPNIPRMLGITDKIKLNKNRFFIPARYKENKNLKVISRSLYLVDSNRAFTTVGLQSRTLVYDFLRNTEWGKIEYLCVDAPAGSGDELKAILNALSKNVKGVVIVAVPTATDDLHRALDICRRFYLPLIGILENMSGTLTDCDEVPICPKCKKEFLPFGNGVTEEECKKLGLESKYLGKIPLSSAIKTNLDNNKPELPDSCKEPILKAVERFRSDICGDTK